MNTLLNKFKTHLILLFITGIMISCNKDKESEGKYSITYYPEIELIGDKIISVVQDNSYEELGVIATEQGAEIEYTVSGNVDVSTPGIYTISYSASNQDGFSKTETRTVFVISEEVVEGSASISGTYARAANGRISTVTSLAPGVYSMSDGWGSASSGGNPLPIACYLVCTDGVNIDMPEVPTVFGGMTGFGTFDGTQMSILTILLDQGPAERVNVWVKQ